MKKVSQTLKDNYPIGATFTRDGAASVKVLDYCIWYDADIKLEEEAVVFKTKENELFVVSEGFGLSKYKKVRNQNE